MRPGKEIPFLLGRAVCGTQRTGPFLTRWCSRAEEGLTGRSGVTSLPCSLRAGPGGGGRAFCQGRGPSPARRPVRVREPEAGAPKGAAGSPEVQGWPSQPRSGCGRLPKAAAGRGVGGLNVCSEGRSLCWAPRASCHVCGCERVCERVARCGRACVTGMSSDYPPNARLAAREVAQPGLFKVKLDLIPAIRSPGYSQIM